MKCPDCEYDLGEGMLPARCPSCGANLATLAGGSSKMKKSYSPVKNSLVQQSKESYVEDASHKSSRAYRKVLALFLVLSFIAIVALLIVKTGIYGKSTLPDCIGVRHDYAVETLENLGCEVESVFEKADKPSGFVMGMQPAAGSEVERNQKVVLTISDQRIMPDTVGKTKTQALQLLEEQGMKAHIEYEPSDEPADMVVQQNVEAGKPIVSTRKITLLVTRGRHVPNLSGMSEAEARERLEDEGLKCRVIYVPKRDNQEGGTVISSTPGANTQVQKDSMVVLKIVWGQNSSFNTMCRKILSYVYDCDPMEPEYCIGKNLRSYASPEADFDDGVSLEDASDKDIWYALIKNPNKELEPGVDPKVGYLSRHLVSVNSLRLKDDNTALCNITVTWYWGGLGEDYKDVISTDTRDVYLKFDDAGRLLAVEDKLSDMPVYEVEPGSVAAPENE